MLMNKPKEICIGNVLQKAIEKQIDFNIKEEFVSKDCGDYFLFGLKKVKKK